MAIMDASLRFPKSYSQFETLDTALSDRPRLQPSLVEPPSLELKPLPSHLRYVFLGSNETLPVIIACDLNSQQEEKLMEVLKAHKRAIG